jgi:hypothetical protein
LRLHGFAFGVIGAWFTAITPAATITATPTLAFLSGARIAIARGSGRARLDCSQRDI